MFISMTWIAMLRVTSYVILILEMLMAMIIIIMMRTTMLMIMVAIMIKDIPDDYYVDDGASSGDSDPGSHIAAPSITIPTLARRPTHAQELQNSIKKIQCRICA